MIAYPPGSLLQTAAYNKLNQLTTLQNPPPTPQSLTYDQNGNLHADATRSYRWDAENRLVSIGYVGQAGRQTAFAYDGLDRRVQMVSTPTGGHGAVITNYVWCGARLCQARDGTGALIRSYYDEGEVVAGAPTTTLYYAPDRIGSVRRVFSASASPAYDYDPYGAPLQATPPVTDSDTRGRSTTPTAGSTSRRAGPTIRRQGAGFRAIRSGKGWTRMGIGTRMWAAT